MGNIRCLNQAHFSTRRAAVRWLLEALLPKSLLVRGLPPSAAIPNCSSLPSARTWGWKSRFKNQIAYLLQVAVATCIDSLALSFCKEQYLLGDSSDTCCCSERCCLRWQTAPERRVYCNNVLSPCFGRVKQTENEWLQFIAGCLP